MGENEVLLKQIVQWIGKIETKLDTLNDRTKRQTLQIRELQKGLKGVLQLDD